jgi:hypothetical protein
LRKTLISMGIAALLLAASPVSANDRAPTPGVIPPGSTPRGQTYAQWSAQWWQWALEQPNVASSPVVDPNAGTPSQPEPVDCTLLQSGQVWFLAGVTFLQSYPAAYRSCTVPSGVSLFFPVIDSWIDNLSCPGQPPGTLTADELRQLVKQQTDAIVPGSMSVSIDGRSVQGLADGTTAYRAGAGSFSYSFPANSPIGPAFCGVPFPAGTSPPPPGAFADGVYIMLPPLSVGVHRITFAAQEANGPFGSVSENVIYTITVRGS